MSLFTDDIYVEFHSRGNIMTVPPVKLEVHQGYRRAKREAVRFLRADNAYTSAQFFTDKSVLIAELNPKENDHTVEFTNEFGSRHFTQGKRYATKITSDGLTVIDDTGGEHVIATTKNAAKSYANDPFFRRNFAWTNE